MIHFNAGTDALSTALHFHNLGLSVFPIVPNTKRPAVKQWEQWQTHEQAAEEIESLDWTGSLACVAGPGGFRVIDVDHSDPFGYNTLSSPVKDILEDLGLPEEYEWIVRSGRGYHIWVRCEEELPGGRNMYTERPTVYSRVIMVDVKEDDGTIIQKKKDSDTVGLFFREKYILLPPSSHPDNPDGYRFLSGRFPNNPPALVSLDALVEAVESLIYVPEVYNAQGDTIEEEYIESGVPNTQYGAGVLKGVWKELATQREGGRDNLLMSKAFKVGQYVAGGSIDREDAIEKLIDACTTNGLIFDRESGGVTGIRRKIERAFEKSAPHPRYSPKSTPKEAGNYLLDLEVSEPANARAVMQMFPEQIKYTDERKWMVWTGTHYEVKGAERRVFLMIEQTLQARREAAIKAGHSAANEQIIRGCKPDKRLIEGIMAFLKALTGEDLDSFDQDHDCINLANGVLNLITGELTPHRPGQLFTYCSPVPYDPQADTSMWERFFDENLAGGPEVKKYMQEALGYTLTGRVDGESFFYIYGAPRAGKGTLTEAIKSILGKPLASSRSYGAFTARRQEGSQNFDLAGLEAARFLEVSETSDESINGEFTKNVTGGGEQFASYKHGTPFTFKVRFKIWFTSNYRLNSDGSDKAFWIRAKVFEFPNGRDEDTANPAVKRAMNSEAGLQGLLKWMVEGAQRWYTYDGIWPVPEGVKKIRDEHRNEADSVSQWLDQCCERDEDGFEKHETLYQSYRDWCEKQGWTPKQARRFRQALGGTVGEAAMKRQKRFGKTVERGVGGLTII